MGWLRQESAYERRIRELEEEADRVRKSMQALMKEGSRLPPAAGLADPQRTARRPSATATPRPLDTVRPHEAEERDDAPDVRSTPFIRRAAEGVAPQEKLANYLSTGSFGKGRPLSRERRIQRNKAIFTLLVALLAVYMTITWLFSG
jgi:hypothetical protein